MKKFKVILPFLLGALVAVIILAVPKISNAVASWGNNEIMATITTVGVLIAFVVPIMEVGLEEHLRKKREATVYRIDIHTTILPKNYVRFSASIENVGDKVIETNISNLYIDQGIEINLTNDRDTNKVLGSQFRFPFILEHKEVSSDGRPDCVLCKKCFRELTEIYPEEIVEKDIKGTPDLLRSHIYLDHLSAKSVKYINPKEKFSEDVVVQFRNKGVYRVTLFVGCNGDADCECATKQFYIEKSLDEVLQEEKDYQIQLQQLRDVIDEKGGSQQ